MIQGILLFELFKDPKSNSLFDFIRAVFNNDIYNENSYSDLIDEDGIVSLIYQHITGVETEGDFSNTYQGKLRKTKFQVFSHFRSLSDGSCFLTIFIFDLDDIIDSFMSTIESMTDELDNFFQIKKEGKSLDKRTKLGRAFKARQEEFKGKNSKLSKLFEKTISKINDKNIKIFFSYSNKDSDYYQIPVISKTLLSYPEIKKVIYFEKEKYENIFQFMNDNIEKCDVLLSFCSQNASNSEYVTLEWQAALSKKKKVIPIFTKKDDLPALLAPLNGVKFEQNDLPMSIEKIYQTIQKALKL